MSIVEYAFSEVMAVIQGCEHVDLIGYQLCIGGSLRPAANGRT